MLLHVRTLQLVPRLFSFEASEFSQIFSAAVIVIAVSAAENRQDVHTNSMTLPLTYAIAPSCWDDNEPNRLYSTAAGYFGGGRGTVAGERRSPTAGRKGDKDQISYGTLSRRDVE